MEDERDERERAEMQKKGSFEIALPSRMNQQSHALSIMMHFVVNHQRREVESDIYSSVSSDRATVRMLRLDGRQIHR